jgi:Ca-activated chloride channel family protein
MMEGFHFLRPEWLLAVPVWLALVVWHRRSARGVSAWDRVCDPDLAPYIVESGATRRSGWVHGAAALAGVLAIVALAGPAWRELPQPVFRSQSALVVALDVSTSMKAADIKPSRLARARHKVLDLLEKRVDGQTALVAYAGDAFVVTPLTDDKRTISSLLASLEPDIMPVPGSRTGRALDRSRELLEQAGAPRGRVLLITDGVGGPGVGDSVDALTGSGYTLSVIGIGTPEGAPIPVDGGFLKDASGELVIASLDETALAELARRGGGAYARYVLDDADLRRVSASGDVGEGGAAETTLSSDRWREEGPWLLPVLMVLVLPLFRRGRLE